MTTLTILQQMYIYRYLSEMRDAALRRDIKATEIAARKICFLAEEYLS